MAESIESVEILHQKYNELMSNISQVIVGQKDILENIIIAILCNGHCQLVGVPGLAKTKMVQTLANSMELDFNRIQFTPDLMPSDIIGTEIYEDKEFRFIKGPVFTNILLGDEINRTPPKTQAALLEAMQEKKVTSGGEDFKLPVPFFVLATQNPIEQEGTYPLPEAQLDRFIFQLVLDYPSLEEEKKIVTLTTSNASDEVSAVWTKDDILSFQHLVREVPVTDNVLNYIVNLVHKTRPNAEQNEVASAYLDWGAGPRASQYLSLTARCYALLRGKYSPDIEDVQAMALPVLRHRIVLNYKAEAEGLTKDDVLKKML